MKYSEFILTVVLSSSAFAIDMNQVVKADAPAEQKPPPAEDRITAEGFLSAEESEGDELTPTLLMEGGCFATWGALGPHHNAFYLKSKKSEQSRIIRFFEERDEHIQKLSQLAESFPPKAHRQVKAQMALWMKLFEFDQRQKALFTDYIREATSAERRSEILVQFFRELYPENLNQDLTKPELERFAKYRKIAEVQDENLENQTDVLGRIIVLNNKVKEPCSAASKSMKFILYSYLRNAGQVFQCSNCRHGPGARQK